MASKTTICPPTRRKRSWVITVDNVSIITDIVAEWGLDNHINWKKVATPFAEVKGDPDNHRETPFERSPWENVAARGGVHSVRMPRTDRKSDG